jgi:hypothetical protein
VNAYVSVKFTLTGFNTAYALFQETRCAKITKPAIDVATSKMPEVIENYLSGYRLACVAHRQNLITGIFRTCSKDDLESPIN